MTRFKIGDKALATKTHYDPYTFNILYRENCTYFVEDIYSEHLFKLNHCYYRLCSDDFINYTKLERKEKLEKIKLCSKSEIK